MGFRTKLELKYTVNCWQLLHNGRVVAFHYLEQKRQIQDMFWNILILKDLFLFWLLELSVIFFLRKTIPSINLSILISSILKVLIQDPRYSLINLVLSESCKSQYCLLILDILTRISIINISSKNDLDFSNRQQHLKGNNRIIPIFLYYFYTFCSFI